MKRSISQDSTGSGDVPPAKKAKSEKAVEDGFEDEASDDGGWDDEGGWEEDEGKSGGDSASAGGISGKTTGEAHDEYDAGKIPQGLVQRVEDDLWELRQLVKFEASKPDFGGGSRVKLRLEMPVYHLGLDAEQARAWSLDNQKHIVVDLQMPPHYFNGSTLAEIKVRVGQAFPDSKGEAAPFRLSWMLQSQIKEKFLAGLDRKLVDRAYDVRAVQEIMDVTGVDCLLAIKALRDKKQDTSAALALLLNVESKTKLVRQSSMEEEKALKQRQKEKDAKASQSEDALKLMSMFNIEADVANLALNLEGTVEAAISLLTNDEARAQLSDAAEAAARERSDAEASRSKSGGLAGMVKSLFGGKSESKGDGKEAKQDSSTDIVVRAGLGVELAKHNYLVRLMQFMEERILNCNKFCIICNTPVEFVGMKPTVCGGTLCKMGFEEFGLGFDLGSELREQPQLVDLMITFAVVAAQAGKMNFVTPANVRGTDSLGREVSFLLPAGARDEYKPATGGARRGKGTQDVKGVSEGPALDYVRINQCFSRCPSIPEMQAMEAKGVLKAELDKADPLLFPMIRWILTSTRSHVRLLTPDERIQGIDTEYQFVLMSSSPETEARFQTMKKSCEQTKGVGQGSLYAFHGSDTSNWHSIMRTGLKNMSNTKFMTTGAAYGAGIYMAVDSTTSLGYCKQGGGWFKSMFGPSFKCMALCEVINHPQLKPPHPYYVVPQEEWVTTRFFFILKDGKHTGTTIQKIQGQIPDLTRGTTQPTSGGKKS